METINNTPFQFTLLSGKGPGKKVYIVFIIKGTFDLNNNQIAKAADEQLPIFESDQHHGDPAKTSTKAESDFILFKPKTDVVLLGKAYAPGGIPTLENRDISIQNQAYLVWRGSMVVDDKHQLDKLQKIIIS